ncbi:hypothetical protein [Erythrobacter neustonensis]|uniref:hypothetical protein n=1 Tax=Erythrobacter neustonensis TaxID=1112 RepID=UPI000A53047F|nr:hypothetical protein [Erythrobacter neustonensis]
MPTKPFVSMPLLAATLLSLNACGGEDTAGPPSPTGGAATLTPSVPPVATTALSATTTLTSGTGTADAFTNPDNGNIPDRAKHPLAFPTAIGFGSATSVRASNAVVYKINSLEDSAVQGDGKITYRECALALPVTSPYQIPGGRPRYCVFEVAGAIVIQSPIRITTPRIYIAGQTSPGGIELRLGANYNPVDALIDTRRGGDHMILRHIRARLGEHPGRTSINGDPIRINVSKYQIIDHVSSMFGTDESLELADCTNCTVQWSIIGPNICRNAGHTSALHCKTFFIKPGNRVSIAYNLTQHGEQRGMNLAPGVSPVTAGTTSQADIFNNVMYHFVEENGLLSNQFASPYANYIGNVYLRGPRYQASQPNYLLALYSGATSNPRGFSVYMKDNVTPRRRMAGQFGQSVTDPFLRSVGLFPGVSAGQVCGLNTDGSVNCSITGLNVVKDTSPVRAPGVTAQAFEPWMISTPEQAMRNVLAFSGADLCRHGSCRDNVDALYVEDVRTCDRAPYLFETGWTSRVVDSGGFAKLSTSGAVPSDQDKDGMPDAWERLYSGTNPAVWDANADPDGDGYPNIEEYLNLLANEHTRYRGIYTAGTGTLPAYNCGRPMA